VVALRVHDRLEDRLGSQSLLTLCFLQQSVLFFDARLLEHELLLDLVELLGSFLMISAMFLHFSFSLIDLE
jgi:hypothetical protein